MLWRPYIEDATVFSVLKCCSVVSDFEYVRKLSVVISLVCLLVVIPPSIVDTSDIGEELLVSSAR